MPESQILIHGRFAPNGTVTEIGERPDGLTPQQWFDYLAVHAADAYQTLAGARIVFRLEAERLATLKAQSLS